MSSVPSVGHYVSFIRLFLKKINAIFIIIILQKYYTTEEGSPIRTLCSAEAGMK
jgi:hypothetical protein